MNAIELLIVEIKMNSSRSSSDGKQLKGTTSPRGDLVLEPASKKSAEQTALINGRSSQYVKLNVGGRLYYTTIGTLTKLNDTMLSSMFSGRMETLTDSEGWILIDRCGRHFGTILNYLRDGTVPLPDTKREIAELLAEAKYYLITELAAACEKALLVNEEPESICCISLITSEVEIQMLIKSSSKPIIELAMQQKNKFLNTTNGECNACKNIELFDKLSLRYKDRLLFVKNNMSPNKNFGWFFYNHGKRIADIRCNRKIHTDKTTRLVTVVDFPEGRIYDKVLQVIGISNINKKDNETL